ncbi:hypothetical protein Tco_1387631 [Tanacetum coccineum]
MYHKTTLASDTLIDFQINFSIPIDETVTHWFTLIVLSALRRSDNEDMLSTMNLIHMCRSSRTRRTLKDGSKEVSVTTDIERLFSKGKVIKLKNFKKDATLKLSKSTNQEWYEHVDPEVTRSQDDKVIRWRNEIMPLE